MWIAVPLAFVRNGLVFDGLPVTPPNPALLGVDNEKKNTHLLCFLLNSPEILNKYQPKKKPLYA